VTPLIAIPRLVFRKYLGNSYLDLVGKQSWSIGRDETCDIILSDTWVSRKHALLTVTDTGEFYLEDLRSRNGLMVNNQTITTPVLLQDGDVLMIGMTEIEFSYPADVSSDVSSPEPSAIIPKTVLITLTLPNQAEIWRTLLSAQGLTVIISTFEGNLQQMICEQAAAKHPLPDLLLIDIEAQPSNTYAFCRWCRSAYPKIKLLLFSATRTEIFQVERQWAMYQGAQDLLTGFREQNLVGSAIEITTKVDRALKALEWQPLQQKTLITTLLELQTQIQ
jgi:pSer/pThr/pTyr-binding forkhead associated (FHA) protein